MTTTKLSLRRNTFLTDGKRLVQVLTVDDDENNVIVEDARTLQEFALTHSDLAAGGWRQVKKAKLDGT